MKKLLMVMVLIPLTAAANTEIVDGIEWLYVVKNGRAQIGGMNGARAIPRETNRQISIPLKLGGHPVTCIGDSAFSGCRITSVKIHEGVTHIGKEAFACCGELESVTIPSGVTRIEAGLFRECCALNFVKIPDKVMSIGARAFSNCGNIGSVVIPLGVTNIEECAFWFCKGLKSLTIPAGVRSIGNAAFWGCGGIKSVTIPSSVVSMGNSAFCECIGVESVTIAEGVSDIGRHEFSKCSGLRSVKIPTSVTNIGYQAFQRCEGLESVMIPSSVIGIGGGAFIGCTRLKSVMISSGVKSIGESAFYQCGKLSTVTIPPSVMNIGCYAFSGTPFYDNMSDGLVILGGGVLYTYKGESLPSVAIPFGVTSITDYAFSRCSRLESVAIPSTVASVGAYSFCGCGSLMSFSVDPSNLSYSSRGGMLCTKDGSTLVAGVNGNIEMPLDVTSVKDFAFYGHRGLKSITFSPRVTSIGKRAFFGCIGLESVVIPQNVTNIEEGVFSGCVGLKLVTIPEGVVNIGREAFSGCSEIKSMTIPSSTIGIWAKAFGGCTELTSVTMCGELPSSWRDIFDSCKKLTEIHVPSKSQNWAEMTNWQGIPLVFDGKELECWKGKSDVDGYTWLYLVRKGSAMIGVASDNRNCTLERVHRPRCSETFYCAVSPRPAGHVTVPPKIGGVRVMSIGAFAFAGCDELTSVTIPSSVTNIHSRAFIGCANLKSVDVVKDGNVETMSFDDFCRQWKLEKPANVVNRRPLNTRRSGHPTRPALTNKSSSATNAVVRRPGGRQDSGLVGGSLRTHRMQRRQEQLATPNEMCQSQSEQEEKCRESERTEQRRQLLAIQEELKRTREARKSAENAVK